MSEHTSGAIKGLPENAYKELKPGEEYKPLMPANTTPQEITTYSVMMGLLMAVLFSAAAAYLGLKIGQVFEAAIPIAIIAVGVSTLMKIKGSAWTKCDYSIYRTKFRIDSCRCNFHNSGFIHSKS